MLWHDLTDGALLDTSLGELSLEEFLRHLGENLAVAPPGTYVLRLQVRLGSRNVRATMPKRPRDGQRSSNT